MKEEKLDEYITDFAALHLDWTQRISRETRTKTLMKSRRTLAAACASQRELSSLRSLRCSLSPVSCGWPVLGGCTNRVRPPTGGLTQFVSRRKDNRQMGGNSLAQLFPLGEL